MARRWWVLGGLVVTLGLLAGAACNSEESPNNGSGGASRGAVVTESALDGLPRAEGSFGTLAAPLMISAFDSPEWDAGTVDESLFVEGTGALRWEHALDADGCFEYGGSTFCYIRLDFTDAPLDLSEEEFISMWIHNDVPSEFNTEYHETYEEVVLDWFHFNLNYEGGAYESLVRLDHVGWRQFAFEKGLFGGSENPEGWGAITSIHMFVANVHKPITERTVHIDNLTASVLPPGNVPARFLATFESGSYDPDIGNRLVLGQHVFDEENDVSEYHLEYTTVVDNPVPSDKNPSAKVFMSHVPQEGYIRAEYEATHVETDEKTHIYAWKEYLPSETFDHIDYGQHWLSLGQWKTYPCQEMRSAYGDLICGGGGIFNDRDLQLGEPDEIRFRFRAEPDCYEPQSTFPKDVWTSYALEVYWTNTENGYFRLYQDGEMISEQTDIKTLMDDFQPGDCDMKWALGIYANWQSTGADAITYYLDDMAIFDLDHGVTIDEVLAWQQ